jgi:hypothetical protein
MKLEQAIDAQYEAKEDLEKRWARAKQTFLAAKGKDACLIGRQVYDQAASSIKIQESLVGALTGDIKEEHEKLTKLKKQLQNEESNDKPDDDKIGRLEK